MWVTALTIISIFAPLLQGVANAEDASLYTPYLSARRLGEQSVVRHWEWTTVVMDSSEGRGIQYDTNTGHFVLVAGKSYRITAQLGWRYTSSYPNSHEQLNSIFFSFNLVNAKSGDEISPRAEAIGVGFIWPRVVSSGFLNMIYTPPESGEYYLRIRRTEDQDSNTYLGDNFNIRADTSTYLNIVEMNDEDNARQPLEYLSARLHRPQTISPEETWANKIVNIVGYVPEVKGNNMTFSPDQGWFRLKGGVTYQITAQLGWGAKSWERYAFGLFNYDTGTHYGPLAEILPPSGSVQNVSGGVLDVIHTPEVDGKYCIRMSSNVKAGHLSNIRVDVGTVLNIVALSRGRENAFVAAGFSNDKTISRSETWANKNIVMDKITNHRGALAYDNKSGRFYLSNKETYRITAQLSWGLDSIGSRGDPFYYSYDYPRTFYAFGLFNVDTGEQIGPQAEVLYRVANTNNASGGVLDVIFTPPTPGWYQLKTAPSVTADYYSKLRAASSYLTIVTL